MINTDRFPLYILLILLFSISFSFKGENKNEIKFAFLTDLHVTEGNESENNLARVVDDINFSEVDMVIITGDYTETGSDSELVLVKKHIDKLTKPYLIIPGNHETNWSESACLKIHELWGNDRFIIEFNNFILVGFSTGPFMKMGDGHVKQEDIQWLRKELSFRMDKNKKLLSFTHYPLAEGLDNWFEITDLLKQYGCIAAFCGHGHKPGLHNFDGIPGIMGRSMVFRNDKLPGYNIVEIKNDSLYVFEKKTGHNSLRQTIKFPINNPTEIKGLHVSPKPDYNVNKQFPDITKSYQWTDTASIFSGVCLVGDSVFIYGNSLGWLKAINFKQNKIEWQTKFQGSIYSTPALYNKIIVFGSVEGIIYGLNVKSGTINWKVNTGKPVLASPVIKNHSVFIGGGNTTFYRLNADTGEIIWKFEEVNGLIQGKATVHKDFVVFGAWDRHLYCLSAATGELKWKWNNGRPNILFSPGNIVPVISNKRVFIAAPDRFITSLELKSGKQVWRSNKHQVRESIGISPEGNEVYFKLMNDSIASISTIDKDFKTVWVVDAGIKYDHNPCPLLANNNFVFGATKNGLITAVNRQKRAIHWMHKISNSSVNNMVFDEHNNIWTSSIDGKISRITFKKPDSQKTVILNTNE